MWIPDDRNLYKLLTDWGGLVGGVFALIAGLVAYRAGQHQAKATLDAARDQIAADVEKDRSQAHALAVAIYPELLLVGQKIERAEKIITANYRTNDEFSNNFNLFTGNRRTFGELKVVEPPLIRENGHRLFVMGEAGATIFQLLGVILQYNRMVETLVTQATKGDAGVDDLFGHLAVMKALVELAEQQIRPIHDHAEVG